ncbi:hypothetical protein UFOVP238_46 [uncultured Caudovirales phage]|uniref:Uncharacterized protein n=1 Tax=uncultured Caudovirales phage TaxID=2100421 RepID=A0A6J7WRQ5_9CAUD|nr:hypothetical protein UFOVP238_46 [uncultured Caudovirales phage]
MPTFFHGRNTFFSIADSSGTVYDLSPVLKQVNFPVTLDTPETTAFGSTNKSYVVGIKDAKFTCSGMYASSADVVLQGIFGYATARAFQYGPQGNTTGYPRYTGSCFLVNYQVTGAVGDMVGFSCDFQVSGSITRDTSTFTSATALA